MQMLFLLVFSVVPDVIFIFAILVCLFVLLLCQGKFHCFIFRLNDYLFCFIQFTLEPIWCIFQFTYLILKLCDFCLRLLYSISLLKFFLCSSIYFLSSVNIFMMITLNFFLSGTFLVPLSLNYFFLSFFHVISLGTYLSIFLILLDSMFVSMY